MVGDWVEGKGSNFQPFMVTVDMLVRVSSGHSDFWYLSQAGKPGIWGPASLRNLRSLPAEAWAFPGHCCEAQGLTVLTAW